MTLTLNLRSDVMGAAHRLDKMNTDQRLMKVFQMIQGTGSRQESAMYGLTDRRIDGQMKAITIIPSPIHVRGFKWLMGQLQQ